MTTKYDLLEVIKVLSTMPDSIFDKQLSAACATFLAEKRESPDRFLWNVLDMAVYSALASGVVISFLDVVLKDYPEAFAVQTERRANLEKKQKDWATC